GRRMRHGQVEQVRNDRGAAGRIEVERKLAAAIQNRRAGFPFTRHDFATSRAPFDEGLDDPLGPLGECDLDLANRDPARGAHRKAFEVHFHADRLPARPNELVVDRLSGEPHLPRLSDGPRLTGGGMKRGLIARGNGPTPLAQGVPNRATSPSIQDSIACVNCAASLPSADIDGPIESVIVPGLFPNNPLGHRYPALWAIGNTGAGIPIARRAPPVL